MKKVLMVSAALIASCLQLEAATLTVQEGLVKLNRGKGFQPVKGTVVANAGDLVKVYPKGKARLAWEGSQLDLGPGVTRVVQDPSSFRTEATETINAEGLGTAQINPLYLAGGLAVAGGIAGGVAAATSGGGGSSGLPFIPPPAPQPISQ